MLSVQQAESIILNLVHALKETETVNLENAFGRILATSVVSSLNFPHWDNSAMDGYAVRFRDVEKCSVNEPVTLKVVEEIPAGYQPEVFLNAGEAARIFTGGVMPVGADTIVIQENTQQQGNQVQIFAAPQPEQFVRKRAAFYQAGDPLLQPGIRIGAPEMAILAAAQCTQLEVYRRPRVAIFSTGDELVSPQQLLQPGQIVDSNRYALEAFVISMGGIPISLGVVPDNIELLKEKISQAINSADVVLSTGGVSVGDYDYVGQIIRELGGDIQIESVAIKPGKPLTVATFFHPCLYFGIPGNPVSALISCWRFVQPALKKLSGLSGNWLPSFVKARSHQDLRSGGKRETYLWGQVQLVNGLYEFTVAGGSQNSANLINLSQTNGLAIMTMGKTTIAAGEWMNVMLIE